VSTRRAVRCTASLLAALTTSIALPAAAHPAQSVRLDATFTPERLGHDTTVGFRFEITTPTSQVPPPLTRVQVSYPVQLGFGLSELGLSTCSAAALETFGPPGCPANSLMGYGTALTEIPIGPSIIHETAQVTIVRTVNNRGHFALLIYASGETPVSAQIVFPALVLPAPPPYGGRLDITIPLVPSLPGAPDLALVRFNSTLGPMNLRYHERIHGHLVDYQPKGIPIPNNCPRGGFPFTANFSFLNGSHTHAYTTIPCPHTHTSHE
jgi:hypothetical protein